MIRAGLLVAALGAAQAFTAPGRTPVRVRMAALRAKGFDGARQEPEVEVVPAPEVLNLAEGWACVHHCGACCYLAPGEREGLDELLSKDEMKQLYDMVLDDGWCKHFDKETRSCTTFESRPEFCRVGVDKYQEQFDIKKEEFAEFCGNCCRDHIYDVYGDDSNVMVRFEAAQGADEVVFVSTPGKIE
mmetsp:Transcript_17523/g.53644  ORF Transcript_17523/g.53644 Transcript_17523/m.53644 type:complete len:187 (-) Transcript_17523:1902-2462(-)